MQHNTIKTRALGRPSTCIPRTRPPIPRRGAFPFGRPDLAQNVDQNWYYHASEEINASEKSK